MGGWLGVCVCVCARAHACERVLCLCACVRVLFLHSFVCVRHVCCAPLHCCLLEFRGHSRFSVSRIWDDLGLGQASRYP